MIDWLAWLTLLFAGCSACSFLRNLLVFDKAVDDVTVDTLPAVSVMIPARDEAAGIERTLIAVLANENVDLEVLVLDDQSRDNTQSIVERIAAADARVRLLPGKPLPGGWCGKQYACHQLAEQARCDELLFIDADVQLSSDAIRRCVLQRRAANVDLLSGFPRQVVGSFGEALLIPMIHIVLLTYLPFRLMRTTNRPSASAGCGQLFITCRDAYTKSGGHAAIRASLHDGVMLPRTFRRAGLRTDVFDASDISQCRMYHGWLESCKGLMKNAHEGIANGRLIVPATSLMLISFFLPATILIYQLASGVSFLDLALVVPAIATSFSYIPRLVTAARFDRAWFAALLFPVSILLFVVLQWIAFLRTLFGGRSSWRGRAYSPTTA